MIKLNLGCGAVRPNGWVNADSSLNANLQRIPVLGSLVKHLFKTVAYDNSNVVYMNVNQPWSAYKDNSVDIVYSSHMFEHLSLKSSEHYLKESFRCLKPGGVIRIAIPDLYKISKKYITDYEAGLENPSDHIMWAINMHREGMYGSKIGIFKKAVLEWQGYPHQHKFMYDEKSLAAKLRKFGFVDILSLEYGVSHYIAEIKDVEGKRELFLSVYLEAKKPS